MNNLDQETDIKLNILKWIAGFREVPDKLEIRDPIHFLELVWRNRLVGRLAEIVRRHELPWAGDAFQEELDKLLRANKLRIAQQTFFLEAMSASYRKVADTQTPLLLLKGQTAFRLLGTERASRWSLDIDISCAEPDRLVEILKHLGYEQVGAPRTTQSHSVTMVRKDSVPVDIQPSFCVFAMGRPETPEELSPKQHLGVWEQSIGVTRHPITYEDLLDHSIEFDIGSESIACANPAMAVLVAAAHVFRNSFYNPPKVVPLAELSEIVELTRHVDYSSHEHAELVSAHGAATSMEVVRRIICSLGDHPCLSDQALTAPEPASPFFCRHDIFWTTAPWTTYQVLNMGASASASKMVDHLVPSQVDAPMKPAVSKYELIHAGSSTDRLDRAMSYGGFVNYSQVSLGFSHSGDALTIQTMVETRATAVHVIRFRFGSTGHLKWVYDRESGEARISNSDIALEYEVSALGYTVTTGIPYSELYRDSEQPSQISIVLTLMNTGRDIIEIEGALLVPLCISIF